MGLEQGLWGGLEGVQRGRYESLPICGSPPGNGWDARSDKDGQSREAPGVSGGGGSTGSRATEAPRNTP